MNVEVMDDFLYLWLDNLFHIVRISTSVLSLGVRGRVVGVIVGWDGDIRVI